MRRTLLAVGGILLSACATSYRPPSEPAPALWTGAHGFVLVEDSVAQEEGTAREGDVLARWQVAPKRPGTVAEDVVFRGALGGEVVIPAGAPAAAQQFTLMRSSYGVRSNANGQNDPVEWCARAVDDQLYCAFWEAPDRARYLRMDGTLAMPKTSGGTAGTTGPVPVIEEGGEPAVADVTLVLKDLGRRDVRLSVPSEGGLPYLTRKAKWQDGEATTSLYGANVTLTHDAGDGQAPSAARVAFSGPMRPGMGGSEREVAAALLTATRAALAKAEAEGRTEDAEKLRELVVKFEALGL